MKKVLQYSILLIFIHCNGNNERFMQQNISNSQNDLLDINDNESEDDEKEDLEVVKIIKKRRYNLIKNNNLLRKEINDLNSKIEKDKYEAKQINNRISQLEKELIEFKANSDTYKKNKKLIIAKKKDKKHENKTLKNLLKDIIKLENKVVSYEHEVLANESRISDIKYEIKIAKINNKISDENIQHNMFTKAEEDKNYQEEYDFSKFFRNIKNKLNFWNKKKIKQKTKKIIKDKETSFEIKLNETEKSLGLENHQSLICKNQTLKNFYLDKSINKLNK